MKSQFVSFRYLDDDNNEQDAVLNIAQIVTILPYEDGGTLITMINDEEFLVTTEYPEMAKIAANW
ncbi:MAG: hypothetical protein V4543_03445 [Bacteroidota bacterium]